MYEYIKGLLVDISVSKVVVDVQGIGYRLLIPFNHFAKLPPLGSPVTFFVTTIIREDSHTLFGFLNPHERELFEQFTEISGIGPKTALALVGHLELRALQTAIAQGNIAAMCKIPGIGKKTAERLIVEMRDKIFKIFPSHAADSKTAEPEILSDALSALIHLGYNQPQAQKALKAAMTTFKTEPELAALITAALSRI